MHQASLSVAFPRQESQSSLPLPSLRDLPDQGTEPISPALAGRFFTTQPHGKPWCVTSAALSSLCVSTAFPDLGYNSQGKGFIQSTYVIKSLAKLFQCAGALMVQ